MAAGAGPLADRLALQHVGAPVPDGATGYTETRTTYATLWAEVAPADARGVERTIGFQVQAPVSHLARIYHRSDVKVTDVGTWTDRRGGVHAVRVTGLRPDPHGVWLWLALEERLSG